MNSKLPIYYKKKMTGFLEKLGDGSFVFEYTQDYINSAYPDISYTFPKNEKIFNSDNLFPFFDGLIPEGWILNLASQKFKLNPISERFELLSKLCADTIGAVHVGNNFLNTLSTESVGMGSEPVLDTKDVVPQSFGKCLICYEPCEDIYHKKCMLSVFKKEIEPYVDIRLERLEILALQNIKKKQAIGGVQKKISLDFDNTTKKTRLTLTNLWGRFIFKPKSLRPHLPENEHLCLKLAQMSGIVTAKNAMIPTADGTLGLISVRFDRDENFHEFHMEDFCQLLKKNAYQKYIGSYEQVGKTLKKISKFPGDDLYRLYEFVMFNFLIGNVDVHLKNISILYESKKGWMPCLSPAYDLLSTDLYIEDDNEEVALAINGKKNKIKEEDFLSLAKSFGIPLKVHYNIVTKFKKLIPSWELLIDKSFLEEHKKIEFKNLISGKMQRFLEK